MTYDKDKPVAGKNVNTTQSSGIEGKVTTSLHFTTCIFYLPCMESRVEWKRHNRNEILKRTKNCIADFAESTKSGRFKQFSIFPVTK